LFIRGKYNDAISNSGCIKSNEWDELRRICKEAVVVLFKIITLYLPGGTEKTTKYLTQDIQSTFEVNASQIQVGTCLAVEVSFRIVVYLLITIGVFCFHICLTTLLADSVVCENARCG
jgi:hypothetical protein